jgi:hypothetical protein
LAHEVSSDALNEARSDSGTSVATDGPTGTHSETAEVAATPQTAAASAILRGRLERARCAYEMAALVHQRAERWQIDSAPLAHHCAVLLMRVLLELHGEPAPDDFGELAGRATRLAELHGLVLRDLEADLAVIADARAQFDALDYEPTRANWRKYDRAFQRIAELFVIVESELSAVLPPQASRVARHWKTALLVASALVLGGVIGKKLATPRTAATQAAGPLRLAQPAGAATNELAATFYRDEGFHDTAMKQSDTAINFEWGHDAPPGLGQVDHFSARWTGRLLIRDSGVYEFFLTSDDGSRLFIDEQLVVDNWGLHATAAQQASTPLESGIHLLRVEYFETSGDANLKLEWSSKAFARRLLGGDDLR